MFYRKGNVFERWVHGRFRLKTFGVRSVNIDKKKIFFLHKTQKANIYHSIQVKISLLIQEKNNCNFLCAIFYTY